MSPTPALLLSRSTPLHVAALEGEGDPLSDSLAFNLRDRVKLCTIWCWAIVMVEDCIACHIRVKNYSYFGNIHERSVSYAAYFLGKYHGFCESFRNSRRVRRLSEGLSTGFSTTLVDES